MTERTVEVKTFRIADWADWNAVFRVDHDGVSLPELLDKATDAAMKG